ECQGRAEGGPVHARLSAGDDPEHSDLLTISSRLDTGRWRLASLAAPPASLLPLAARFTLRYGAVTYFAGFPSTTDISTVAGATRPSFQSSNDRITFARPMPASSGTRTGP